MTLSTKNFDTLVSDQTAAVQSSASGLIDFSEGSVLRAIIESNAAVALWLESLVIGLLAVTRAATSSGSDLDSFVADFGLTREPSVPSSGSVTFSRFTDTQSALVPLGLQVQTADGSVTFVVTEDATNPAWSPSQQGYVINSGTPSVTVPVMATAGGSVSNVVANSITLILSAVPGVNTVTNALAFTGGADAETDAALRLRFQSFLNSLARGTLTSISYAISTVQTGLTDSIAENVNPDGSPHPGYLTITVDDGTGSPPGSLLTAAAVAVDQYRGAGIAFGVFGPTKLTANVVFALTTETGYDHSTVVAEAVAAVVAFINGLSLGYELPYTRLVQVIYDSSPGITNVTGVTLNGGTSDMTATAAQVVRAGTVSGS